MTLREIEIRLRSHPLIECEIPLQVQFGLPYLYEKNGQLFLRYLLHRQRYEGGILLIYPKRYELELIYPFRRIVLFEDCRRHMPEHTETLLCSVEADRLLTCGKMLLEELYAKADKVIHFWGQDRALLEKSLLDCQNVRQEIIKEFNLGSLYGG